jgi:hypothetical protein
MRQGNEGFLFTIRKEVMDAYKQTMVNNFAMLVLAHIRKCFPAKFQSLGEPAVRETIKYGIARAAAYGIQGERDVCKYIDLMMVLGRDFDRQLPWVSKVLNDCGSSPDIRICRLYERAMNPQK